MFTDIACAQIQASLMRAIGRNAGEVTRSKTGFLDWLESSTNTAGVQKLAVNTENGSLRETVLNYIQPLSGADTLPDKPDLCAATNKPEPLTQSIKIEMQVWTPGQVISLGDFKRICNEDVRFDSYRIRLISSLMNALDEEIDKAILAKMVINMGNFYNSTNTAQSVTLVKNEGPNYAGLSKVLQFYDDIRGQGMPALIGSGILREFTHMTQAGCCNDLGIDISKANGQFMFFSDKFVDAIFGTNEFIALSPNAVHFLQWNEYQGDFEWKGDTGFMGKLIDPIKDRTYSMKMVFNVCDENVKLMLGTYFDLYVPPSDMYKVGDPMEGVNGTLRFQAVAV